MSLKEKQIASLVILVAVLVLSFYVSGPESLKTTVVRSFPQTKIVQEGNLFVLEMVNPTPIRFNYSYVSNTTISLFVQTRSQFESSNSDVAPEDYLATFTGDEGILVFETEDQSKRHVISVFAEERYLVREIILEASYQSVTEWKPTIVLYLLQLLTVVTLAVQGYTVYLQNQED